MFHAAVMVFKMANAWTLKLRFLNYFAAIWARHCPTYTTDVFSRVIKCFQDVDGVRHDSGDREFLQIKSDCAHRSMGIDPRSKTIIFSWIE